MTRRAPGRRPDTAVDGTSTAGPDQAKVLDTIRGVPGTVVDLTVELTPGEKTPRLVSVTRATVKDRVVDWAMILVILRPRDGPAQDLLEGCAREVRSAIGSAIAAGATGIVFDLRGNPGGLGMQAVYVASVSPATGHRGRPVPRRRWPPMTTGSPRTR